MHTEGGVTLRQFAPERYVPNYKSEQESDISVSDNSISKPMDNSPGRKFTGNTQRSANFSNTMRDNINGGSQVMNFEER